MKRSLGVAFLLSLSVLLSTLAADGATVNGVSMPDTIDVEGKTLKLNGIGVRTKTFLGIKIYVAGLYVEKTGANAEAVVAGRLAPVGIRRIVVQMTHGAPERRVVAEVREGFERNAGGRMPAFKERLDTFLSGLPELKAGQGFSLTYVPARGTTLRTSAGREITVAGVDFADVLFGAWLGSDPLDRDLKKQLLGEGR